MAKPKVSDQTWNRIFHNPIVDVFESEEHEGFYFKVMSRGKSAKYFYGETAWSDYQRYAYDETISATLT